METLTLASRAALTLTALGLVLMPWQQGWRVEGHGRLIDPPSRATMWRYGFDVKANYDDNAGYCGGKSQLWSRFGGKCGVCGDPYLPIPRAHERGGRYYDGTPVRHYRQGDVIDVVMGITANHRGWVEFRLCAYDHPDLDDLEYDDEGDVVEVTHACLDKHVLQLADGTGTRYTLPEPYNVGQYSVKVALPHDLSCRKCLFQWKWNVANSWGTDEDGTSCLGCGEQEQFYACADIVIKPAGGGHPRHPDTPKPRPRPKLTPPPPPVTQAPPRPTATKAPPRVPATRYPPKNPKNRNKRPKNRYPPTKNPDRGVYWGTADKPTRYPPGKPGTRGKGKKGKPVTEKPVTEKPVTQKPSTKTPPTTPKPKARIPPSHRTPTENPVTQGGTSPAKTTPPLLGSVPSFWHWLLQYPISKTPVEKAANASQDMKMTASIVTPEPRQTDSPPSVIEKDGNKKDKNGVEIEEGEDEETKEPEGRGGGERAKGSERSGSISWWQRLVSLAEHTMWDPVNAGQNRSSTSISTTTTTTTATTTTPTTTTTTPTTTTTTPTTTTSTPTTTTPTTTTTTSSSTISASSKTSSSDPAEAMSKLLDMAEGLKRMANFDPWYLRKMQGVGSDFLFHSWQHAESPDEPPPPPSFEDRPRSLLSRSLYQDLSVPPPVSIVAYSGLLGLGKVNPRSVKKKGHRIGKTNQISAAASRDLPHSQDAAESDLNRGSLNEKTFSEQDNFLFSSDRSIANRNELKQSRSLALFNHSAFEGRNRLEARDQTREENDVSQIAQVNYFKQTAQKSEAVGINVNDVTADNNILTSEDSRQRLRSGGPGGSGSQFQPVSHGTGGRGFVMNRVCRPVGGWVVYPDMWRWCAQHCKEGYCPRSHCICT